MKNFLMKMFGALMLATCLSGAIAEAGVEGVIIGGKGETVATVSLSKEVYRMAVEGLKHYDTVYVVVRNPNGEGLTILAVREENGRIVTSDGTEITTQTNRSIPMSLNLNSIKE